MLRAAAVLLAAPADDSRRHNQHWQASFTAIAMHPAAKQLLLIVACYTAAVCRLDHSQLW
jgi:hypothetical protein